MPSSHPSQAVDAMAIVVTKDMGLTHREFYRSFAMMAGDWRWEASDNHVVTVDHPDGPVTITLEPERRRKIALISMPSTIVRFEFAIHDQASVDAFMKRFDTHFKRGGG